MSTQCELVADDLAAIVDGDRDVIARHAEHLASCDNCRDARHEASQLAKLVAGAGADHVPTGDVVERLMTALDVETAPVMVPPPKRPPADKQVTSIESRRKHPWLALGAAAAAIAATSTVYVVTRHGTDSTTTPTATRDGSIGKLAAVSRAAADKVDGVSVRTDNGSWHPLREHASLAAGSEIKTDARTRTSIDLADGSHLVLDHLTTIAF